MNRLEEIIKRLNQANQTIICVMGVDHEVVQGYGGEQISTSPERIDRIRHLFSLCERACNDYSIVTLPDELADHIRILALSGTINKRELLLMIGDKFTPFFDDKKDYGGFFDVCKIYDKQLLAEMVLTFLGGMKRCLKTIEIIFDK